jgi:hypothetical protein
MNSFKRSGTAIALVMASAFPAFAQDTMVFPEGMPGRVVIQMEGTSDFYRVPLATAAELCGDISEEAMAAAVANADAIFCTVAADTFDTESYIERINDAINGNEDEDNVADSDGPDAEDGADGADEIDGTDDDQMDDSGENDGDPQDGDSSDGDETTDDTDGGDAEGGETDDTNGG